MPQGIMLPSGIGTHGYKSLNLKTNTLLVLNSFLPVKFMDLSYKLKLLSTVSF